MSRSRRSAFAPRGLAARRKKYEQIAKALGISAHHGWAKIDTEQSCYSIAGRLEREISPMIADQKVGLLVWWPLAGGPLSGEFDSRTRDAPSPASRRLRGIAQGHSTSVARVALAWMLSKDFVTSLIVGAKTIEQLNDNLDASGLDLSAAARGTLDAIPELPPEYPRGRPTERSIAANVSKRDPQVRRASGYSYSRT